MWKKQLLQTEEKHNYKISMICFREIKTVRHHQCLQSRNHCSRQWWFLQLPCLLEDFFCLFVSRLIVTTAYQSPFFFLIYCRLVCILLYKLLCFCLPDISKQFFLRFQYWFCLKTLLVNSHLLNSHFVCILLAKIFFWNFEFSITTC